MVVALSENDVTGSDPFSLLVGIRLFSIETGEHLETIFDHQRARDFVSREQAAPVNLLILQAISMLVEHVNPGSILMETYEPELPAEAMVKFTRYSNRLQELGYAVENHYRSEDDLKDYWSFSR